MKLISHSDNGYLIEANREEYHALYRLSEATDGQAFSSWYMTDGGRMPEIDLSTTFGAINAWRVGAEFSNELRSMAALFDKSLELAAKEEKDVFPKYCADCGRKLHAGRWTPCLFDKETGTPIQWERQLICPVLTWPRSMFVERRPWNLGGGFLKHKQYRETTTDIIQVSGDEDGHEKQFDDPLPVDSGKDGISSEDLTKALRYGHGFRE